MVTRSCIWLEGVCCSPSEDVANDEALMVEEVGRGRGRETGLEVGGNHTVHHTDVQIIFPRCLRTCVAVRLGCRMLLHT